MSFTNGTPFLNLPQTIGSDHRDWFDTNESFLDLDTKVKTLWDDSGSAASAIDALEELTATLQTDLTALEGTVDTHTSALSTINEALVLINGTLATLNTSVATKFDSAGIADPYDAAHGVYSVGAVVTYNGQRYVCNTAVTAAEPFDADKWTAEDVQSAIDDIISDVSNINKNITISGSPMSAGTQIDIDPNLLYGGYEFNILTIVIVDSIAYRFVYKVDGAALRTDGTHDNIFSQGYYAEANYNNACNWRFTTTNKLGLDALIVNGNNVKSQATTYVGCIKLK